MRRVVGTLRLSQSVPFVPQSSPPPWTHLRRISLHFLCAVAASSVVNMRRITHPAVEEPLGGGAVLPCVFTLQTSSSQPPHVLWTHIRQPAGAQDAAPEQIVLSAKGETTQSPRRSTRFGS